MDLVAHERSRKTLFLIFTSHNQMTTDDFGLQKQDVKNDAEIQKSLKQIVQRLVSG